MNLITNRTHAIPVTIIFKSKQIYKLLLHVLSVKSKAGTEKAGTKDKDKNRES